MKLSALNRAVLFVFMSLFVFPALSGCGNSETSERQAFIEFLQKRVIDKPGIRIPRPADQEKQSFGQYAAHFDIIASYSHDIDGIMNPTFKDVASVLRISTLQGIAEGRATLTSVRAKTKESRERFMSRLEKVKADYVALKQPDDLKAVYSVAYNRMVTESASLLTKLLTVIDDSLDRCEALSAFLEKNKASIKLTGLSAEVTDPQVLEQMNAQVEGINTAAKRLQEVQGEIRKSFMGG